MKDLWLIKIGEISLKKGNRGFFERILKENITKKFHEKGFKCQITVKNGRYYLETHMNADDVMKILQATPGIVAFSMAKKVSKTLDELLEASMFLAKEALGKNIGNRFKFEVRRTDKGLPMDSYGYARELGHLLTEALPELIVDVHNPDFRISVELREWGYVYLSPYSGSGGLPAGTAGRGMLLLSGGIDSPVAGYLMSKRGLNLTAIHFHTPPYTSDEAHDKVTRLAAIIAPWCGGLTLLSVPFTECQILIKQSVENSTVTLHTRACMMQIAEKCAQKYRCSVLITGESLGQVASQTVEALSYTNTASMLPIFRPLIGMDKEQIVGIARDIETYETAIEPFDDCCVLFSPERPLTRPKVSEQKLVYDGINGINDLIDKAVSEVQVLRFDSHGNKVEMPTQNEAIWKEK